MRATGVTIALTVRLDGADAAALALAVDPSAVAGTVPLIFPIRWLALAEIGKMLAERVDLSRYVLVHEAQGFTFRAKLAVGVDYLLEVRLTRQDGPPVRLSVAGILRDRSGALVAELTATLCALPRGAQP